MALWRRYRADLGAGGLLLALALVWLLPMLLVRWTDMSTVPYDTLVLGEPWHSLLPAQTPYNAALGDVLLQDHAWRHLLRTYIADGQIPLWNPHSLTGMPFLAGGQTGLLYPPALMLLWGDPDFTHALYTALHLALAGINMLVFGRALRLSTWPACTAGLAYMLGGFTITHAAFSTIIATSAWLPLLLAMIEMILRKQQAKGPVSFRPIPYLLLGALAITMGALAWNPEFFAYALLFAASYALVRLAALCRSLWREECAIAHATGAGRRPRLRSQALQYTLKQTVWLGVMLVLGLSMAAVQLVPFAENHFLSHRNTGHAFQIISDLAWPKRQLLTFWIPNAYGNPSHHRWFDFWTLTWQTAPLNVFGHNTQAIDWGIRSYPAGASYVGLLTWVLLLLALGTGLSTRVLLPGQRRTVWLLAGLGAVALQFALGTPVYRVLHALPGWSAVLTAHNWSFILTFCLAMLGGLGLQALHNISRDAEPDRRAQQAVRVLGLGSCALAVLAVLAALLVWWRPDLWQGPVRQIFHLSEYAYMVFRDERMFLGYQMGNALHLAGAALGAGLLLLGYRPMQRSGHRPWFRHPAGLALLLLAGDLFLSHGQFLPRTEPTLSPLHSKPEVVRFLEDRDPHHHEWRLITLTPRGDRILDANLGFYFGWHDFRGKTPLIPEQFIRVFEALGQPKWRGRDIDLNFSRAGYLYAAYGSPRFLQSPLLDMWNIKYLLTPFQVRVPGWVLIHEDEGGLRLYENEEVFARAFLVPHALTSASPHLSLMEVDPATTVLLEGGEEQTAGSPMPGAVSVRIERYAANEVAVAASTDSQAWLVLADAYAPGWKAYLQADRTPAQETETPVLRANGSLRAVRLPADFTGKVRFVYSPLSLRVGLFFSFLAATCALMMLLWWGWGKYRRTDQNLAESVVVAKNFVVPLNLTFMTRAIDFAFAMFYVRLLGPEGTGQFAFVVALYGIFELISRFGLDTLLTREVARDKTLSHRYLTSICVLRTGIWLLTALAMFGVTLAFWGQDRITLVEVQTIFIFSLAMLFAGYSDAFSAAFHAYEKMEYPASLTTISALVRSGLGALVLLLGWGLPALAWVAVFTTIMQVIWFYAALRKSLFQWQWAWDRPLQRWMLANSFPFLLNSLLANILLNIDIWILRLMAGETASGLYSVALKYRFGITLIPSLFNFAIFPLFSRYARQTGDGLIGAYRLSIRLLTLLSIPIAFGATLLARPLILVVGGAEFIDIAESVTLFQQTFTYTGGSGLALQVVIWTIVLNFINAVTQYVLIALDQQRYLTRAFALAVLFNIGGNALLIPRFGYVGAAVVTILSELFLFIHFHLGIRRHLGRVGWLPLCWKPVLGLAVMTVMAWGLHALDLNVWLIGVATGMGYLGTLYATGELTQLAAQMPLAQFRSLIQLHKPGPE